MGVINIVDILLLVCLCFLFVCLFVVVFCIQPFNHSTSSHFWISDNGSMVLVLKSYGKMQVNGLERQNDSGNKERRKAE